MPLNVQKVKWGHLLAVPAPADRPGTWGDRDAQFAAWILSPAAPVPSRSTRPGLQGVLFDLDGVLVDTAECHYQAWQQLADELGLCFDRTANLAFRGVSRADCLDKLLGDHATHFASEEKRILADRKNSYYLDLIKTLSPRDVLPGIRELLAGLRQLPDGGGGVRLAVVSASKNARLVLDLLDLTPLFDAIIDGNDTARSKPDPQGFLLAADRLRVNPEKCVIIEDAEAGIRAGLAAGMKTIAVNASPATHSLAHRAFPTPAHLSAQLLESLFPPPLPGQRIPRSALSKT